MRGLYVRPVSFLPNHTIRCTGNMQLQMNERLANLPITHDPIEDYNLNTHLLYWLYWIELDCGAFVDHHSVISEWCIEWMLTLERYRLVLSWSIRLPKAMLMIMICNLITKCVDPSVGEINSVLLYSAKRKFKEKAT